MKLSLVENWKDAWRWFSVHCMSLVMTVQGTWMAMPDSLRAGLPTSLVNILSIALLVLGVLGRLVRQDKKDDNSPEGSDEPSSD